MDDKFFVGANKWLNFFITILTFISLLYCSFYYSAHVAAQNNSQSAEAFRGIADQAASLLQEKIKPFPQLLLSTRGLVLASPELSPKQWSAYVNSLNLNYESLGIIGLTYTESVFDYQLETYLEKRQKVFPNFKIFPSGVREEYMVVLYFAPEEISARVRGFDIAVEKHRREAALLGRQTGLMTLTPPISLLPTDAHSLDYLLLTPVFNDNWHPDLSLMSETDRQFKGWVTLGFSLTRLVQAVLAETNHPIRIQVFDNRVPERAAFDSEPTQNDQRLASDKVFNSTVILGDQPLSLKITPKASSIFYASGATYEQESLFIGSIISVLISVIIYLLLNSRFSAVQLASQLLEQFAESETRYKSLFELSPEAIIIHRKGRILLVNKAAQSLLGAESPGLLVARNVLDFVHGDSKEKVIARMEVSSYKPLPFTEEKLLRLDESSFLAEVSSAAIYFEGEPATQVLFRDISSEQEARYEAQISRAVFKYTHEPMMVTNAKGQIILVNSAFSQVTGYDAEDVYDQNAAILSSGYHDTAFYSKMWEALLAEGQWEGEITNRRKNGEIYIQRAHMSAIHGFQDQITHYICVMSDITEQKRELESIRFQALHDPLTHLPNRVLLISETKKALVSAHKAQYKCALLFIDLDGFKPVNDNYGHLVGDKLLKALAKKLSGAIKQDDMVARVGGDEFLVLLRYIEDETDALSVAERLIELIKAPLIIDGIHLFVSASVGVSIYPDHASDESVLIDLADQAMYRVKHANKGRAQLAQAEPNTL